MTSIDPTKAKKKKEEMGSQDLQRRCFQVQKWALTAFGWALHLYTVNLNIL